MGATTSRVSSKTAASVSARSTSPAVKKPISPSSLSQTSTHKPVETKRSEWEDMLNKISGAITSKTMNEVGMNASIHSSNKDHHPAQRRKQTVSRLPGRNVDLDRPVTRPNGRLTQTDILNIYDILRDDISNPQLKVIAKRYDIQESDIAQLFQFTRTYVAKLDDDGTVRGYFKFGKGFVVERFEDKPLVSEL